ncbi:hypothetical protein EYF80_002896 [Liparis tanakae]|uniref:Uncharacterized protein n=1 Tax=Liparis tanakae TaxID=230148 RepID=A0A4Z2JAF5_9TELE|nr:hypothetical protein EYF80_002896 [Liparis tanakae]
MPELCVRGELAGLGGVGALLHVDPRLWWMTRFDENSSIRYCSSTTTPASDGLLARAQSSQCTT